MLDPSLFSNTNLEHPSGTMRVFRGGGVRGPDPLPEKSQNIGFLSNTGQDPL